MLFREHRYADNQVTHLVSIYKDRLIYVIALKMLSHLQQRDINHYNEFRNMHIKFI